MYFFTEIWLCCFLYVLISTTCCVFQGWTGNQCCCLRPFELGLIIRMKKATLQGHITARSVCVCVCVQTPTPVMCVALAAAKWLQSCPTLCDPIDGSPPGSPIPGILQARTLEWVAISFPNAGKWKVKVKSLSRIWLFVTPWTAAHQAPLSMGFSRQEYWSGLPLPSPLCVHMHIYKFGSQTTLHLGLLICNQYDNSEHHYSLLSSCGLWSVILSANIAEKMTIRQDFYFFTMMFSYSSCLWNLILFIKAAYILVCSK